MTNSLIDAAGYRSCVGIILINAQNKVFWAKRIDQDAWQLPQGGLWADETLEEAMLRELKEEIGLTPEHVEILGRTRQWLRYRLPAWHVRHRSKPICYGQKQKWFLLRFIGEDSDVQLDLSDAPEFDAWSWVDYSYPPLHVVDFKKDVYQAAFNELASFI
jgi:putative (di)nucleoside polyphosphate hydrolase